jgi:hypothetical protein
MKMDTVLNNETQSHPGQNNGNRAAAIGDEAFAFVTHTFDDRKVTGAQIAMAANKHPIEDYVVLQNLKSGEVETIRPTETVDLGEPGVERLFVIKADKTNRFAVEGLALEWPRDQLLASQIKDLVHADDDLALVLERDGVDQIFDDDDDVPIGGDGVERFKLKKREKIVTVIYGGETEYELERRFYTTEKLMTVFGVPSGYKLDVVAADGSFRQMEPGERIKVKDGMEFASHPPVGQSS